MAELFPYQQTGAEWLQQARFRLLADEMRLGKTIQVIAAADALKLKTITILCPAVARLNWEREISKWTTLPRTVTPVMSRHDLASKADVRICSYDLAAKLPRRDEDLLVLDECHFLKSTDAARTNVVLSRTGMVHRAARTWFLSGTPAPNHPGELWAMLYVTGQTKMTYEAFVEQFCVSYPSPYGRRIVEGKNLRELRELMAPIVLRRTRKQVFPDAPAVTFGECVVEPGPVDMEINFFAQWADGPDGPAKLDKKIEAQQAIAASATAEAEVGGKDPLATLESIAESVSLWRRYVGLQKVQGVLQKVAQELEDGAYRKIVIFAWHKFVIERLREGLTQFDPVVVYGGTAAAKREKNIYRFQNYGKCRVFIGQVLAAGTAIDLSAASTGLIVEQSWVPGENMQAASRMLGPNQLEPVNVQIVSLAGGIDERMNAVLLKKINTLKTLFD